MNIRKVVYLFLASLFLLMPAAVFSSDVKDIKKVEEKTFKLKKGAAIVIEADNGYVKVEGWDGNEVYLKIIKRAWGNNRRRNEEYFEEIEVDIRKTDNKLIIRDMTNREKNNHLFDLLNSDRWRRRTSVDFELKIPKDMVLEILCDEGDVTISDASCKMYIEVDEGDVELKNVYTQHLDVEVDEGDFICKGLNKEGKTKDSRISVRADEGTVEFLNVTAEELEVQCDEGDIILENGSFTVVDIDTDEGDIEFECPIPESGDFRFYTDEGDIYIYVNRSPSVRIELTADDGKIDSDFDLDFDDRDDGEKAYGKIESGSAKLYARTSEGKIVLQKK